MGVVSHLLRAITTVRATRGTHLNPILFRSGTNPHIKNIYK